MTPPFPPPLVWAAGLGLSLAALAVATVRASRSRAGRLETYRRLDALESRVAALEARTAAAAATPPAATAPSKARRVDRAETTAYAGPTLIVVPDLSAHSPAAATPGFSEPGGRFAAVWELADAGEPAEEIARATGHPVGQVELILGLRRQLPAGGQRPS